MRAFKWQLHIICYNQGNCISDNPGHKRLRNDSAPSQLVVVVVVIFLFLKVFTTLGCTQPPIQCLSGVPGSKAAEA
jgi:hypothetical protein